MTGRGKILNRVRANQPKLNSSLKTVVQAIQYKEPALKFEEVLTSIGGRVVVADQLSDVKNYIINAFPKAGRIVSSLESVNTSHLSVDPEDFKNVDVCILEGLFGVAENGAIWITEALMPDRVLPFITENLILILKGSKIVSNMADAYDVINNIEYAYGTFIAGPSKTADIEQSLVLGAHGPKTLTVFLLSN